jgi:hypothetical protein
MAWEMASRRRKSSFFVKRCAERSALYCDAA